jgi:hypothetical protein
MVSRFGWPFMLFIVTYFITGLTLFIVVSYRPLQVYLFW